MFRLGVLCGREGRYTRLTERAGMSVETMRKVTGYCGFCAVHCPVVTTVDGQRVVSVEPDRAHPYGGAICIKGRAAPEFHDHRDRVNVPLRRTRPKTDPDPGWEPCS